MIINIFNIFLMLQTLIFDIANVEFRCCRHVMLGVVSRGEGGEPLMLNVACNMDRNMGHVGCCVEGEEGGRPLMLDVARNMGHNMGRVWCCVEGEEGGGPLMLDGAHNMGRLDFDLTADG
jgi:hypothetical protein